MKSKIHELKKNNFKLVSKKFMFSAIAMMAFSVSLMANNDANQELIVLPDPDCDGAAYDAMNWAESEGLSDSDTITVMNWAYAICWLRQNSDRGWF